MNVKAHAVIWTALLAAAPLAAAAGKAATKSAPTATPCAATAKPAKGAKTPQRRLGRILSLDLEEEVVTLTDDKGGETELQVEDKTVLTKGGKYKAATLKDFKKDDRVHYIAEEDAAKCLHLNIQFAKKKKTTPVKKAVKKGEPAEDADEYAQPAEEAAPAAGDEALDMPEPAAAPGDDEPGMSEPIEDEPYGDETGGMENDSAPDTEYNPE